MNEIWQAAINMGIDLPLFPTKAHLTCELCGKPIEHDAQETEDGYWLHYDCAALVGRGPTEARKEKEM